MANGDIAAAAGMDVVPPTADIRQGYDEINRTRDYLASFMGSDIDATTIGGRQVIVQTTTPAYVEGAIWLKPQV